MDNLPIQLHNHLAKYLGPRDLQNMRLMNKKWDGVAKDKLQGQGFNFIFQDIQMLIQFNTIFANYDPPEYLSSSKFTFMLPVLASTEALPHFNTFEQTFGTSVTRLILNFNKPEYGNGSLATEDYEDGPWGTAQEKATVNRHVTLLLSSVKNRIVELQFQSYTGLDPSVLGTDPFPVLGTVKIQNNERYSYGHAERQNAGYVAANEEACVLDLSQKIPSIENFGFERYFFTENDSPTYLPAVLQNLVQANPNVLCQLEFSDPGGTPGEQFGEAVAGVPIKLSEFSETTNNQTEQGLRTILALISRNADTLKKLSIGIGNYRNRSDYSGSLYGLKFPPLPVLEELNYFQYTRESLLGFDSADRYPNLRKVSTYFTANDFVVPHPTVVDLTLDLKLRTGGGMLYNGAAHNEAVNTEAELGRLILATFPNITNLTCYAAFPGFQSFYNFPGLRKLKITRSRNDFMDAGLFWACITQNAPKISFDRILAVEAPAEREILRDSNGNALPTFQDIQNLEELVVSIQTSQEVIESLDAILYASKFKKLQRLQKLVIELCPDLSARVLNAYFEELKKYHDDVVVVQQVSIY